MYDSIICHLYIASCAHHPKLNLLPSPIKLLLFLYVFSLELYFYLFLFFWFSCRKQRNYTYLRPSLPVFYVYYFLLSFPVSFLFHFLYFFKTSFNPLFSLNVFFIIFVFSLASSSSFFISSLALLYFYHSFFFNFAYHMLSSLFVLPLPSWDHTFLLWASNASGWGGGWQGACVRV